LAVTHRQDTKAAYLRCHRRKGIEGLTTDDKTNKFRNSWRKQQSILRAEMWLVGFTNCEVFCLPIE